ncbi:MAG: glutaryl-7-ACA acylase [Candidatus Zixiibacteriota bacterium]|nr:MAG: glutaryl-7-ACA acylase [candidate division Zixibacteria bacterium]
MVSKYQTISYRKTALVWLIIAFISSALVLAKEQPLRESYLQDNFVIREAMVPMRDGVKLYTLIISPKKNTGAFPVILKRTPYNASDNLNSHASSRLKVTIGRQFLGDDYIYVIQDTRGRFKSEGKYLMFRAPRGAFNKTETDETTDAWDTVDWIVKNIPSNGRVGIWGNSYPGWLTLAAMRDPHPALAAAVPLNPVVDVWKADDWFHWGAFRGAFAFNFIYSMETKLDEYTSYPYDTLELYTWLLKQGSVTQALGARLDERHEMWKRIVENPSYGPYWRDVAADQWFDKPPRLVPALHVHSLWDQEDIYGSPAVYAAVEKHDVDNNMNFFVAGPWSHGQHSRDGSHLGDITFDQDTAKRYREDILQPFLRRYLHGETDIKIAPVTVFETGKNRWRHYKQWPPVGKQKRLYLQAKGALSFSMPAKGSGATGFVSDPAHPVPYAPRPNWRLDYDNPIAKAKWRRWLVEDQRFVDGRPDVVTWVSEPLDHSITIRGAVTAHLFAETTGTDADWVVKLIDVYPDDALKFEMSGYQLMISGDIFRGRYREDITKAKPIAANEVLEYTLPLPHVNHTILPGHRLMIQIQSTWFPLYDRNPQTFVPSIMSAPNSAYKKQQHRVHHSAEHATYIEFRVDACE